jgi:putative peptide zinc metalloprotease protein
VTLRRSPPLDLVLPDHTRLALTGELTIGRAEGSTLRLTDPTVSRAHARIRPLPGGGAAVEDAGSSYGTWVDGRRIRAPTPLRAGAHIRVGDQELLVDRRQAEDEASQTVVVSTSTLPTTDGHPRVRGGYALKRLDGGEGERRWVFEHRRSGRFLRLTDADAGLLRLLDGTRSLADLVGAAETRLGESGPARLMLLLAALGDRGLLDDGGDDGGDDTPARPPGVRGLIAPRNLVWRNADAVLQRLYRSGGRWLLLRPVLVALGVLAITGAVAFAALIAFRYGTPFVVARKIGIGGAVFIVGRLAVASVHETAHGLVMASFGRPVREAGFKLVLIFPYFYVDTSQAWFEPRRRRIAVAAAGPASDLSLGGLFSLLCVAAAPGPLRDVLFQLAFGAYVGAFFNLNPLVERDGYQILVDVLGEPGLRRRGREELGRRLSGRGPGPGGSPAVMRYAVLGAVWSGAGALAAVALSLRYQRAFATLLPAKIVWPVMWVVWLALLAPVLAMVVLPALQRMRARAG